MHKWPPLGAPMAIFAPIRSIPAPFGSYFVDALSDSSYGVSALLQGFRSPDWGAPLNLDDRLAHVPEGATVKGLLLQSACKQASAAKLEPLGRGSYTPFRDYPIREYMTVLYTGASKIHAGVDIREGLRRLGRPVFGNLAKSLIGRVIYGSLGRDANGAEQALHKIAKGYAVATNHGAHAKLEHFEYGRAVVHLSNVWSFPDAYHVGILEGAFEHYGYPVESRINIVSPSEVRILLEWSSVVKP